MTTRTCCARVSLLPNIVEWGSSAALMFINCVIFHHHFSLFRTILVLLNTVYLTYVFIQFIKYYYNNVTILIYFLAVVFIDSLYYEFSKCWSWYYSYIICFSIHLLSLIIIIYLKIWFSFVQIVGWCWKIRSIKRTPRNSKRRHLKMW